MAVETEKLVVAWEARLNDFERQMKKGEREFQRATSRMTAEAKQFEARTGKSFVLDKDMIAKAEELDRLFNRVSTTIGTRMKAAILDVITKTRELAAGISAALEAPPDTAQDALGGIERKIADINANIEQARLTQNMAVIGQLETWLRELQAERAKLRAALATPAAAGLGPTGDVPLPGRKPAPPAQPGSGGYSGGLIVSGYADLQKSAQADIEALRLQGQVLGKTAGEAARLRFEHQLLAEAQRNGTKLTDDQRVAIGALATEYGTLSAEIDAAAEKNQRMIELQNQFGQIAFQGIQSLIDGSKSLNEVLADTLKSLADIALQAAVMGAVKAAFGGADAGSLFGFAGGGVMTSAGPMPLRKYAGGGVARSPQLAMFGEGSRPEAFVPLPDGRNIPVTLRMPDLKGMGGSNPVNISISIPIDARGATQEDMVILTKRLDRLEKNLPAVIDRRFHQIGSRRINLG